MTTPSAPTDCPHTKLGERAICAGCKKVNEAITYVPCLDCTGKGTYNRFYSAEELRWWSEQYRANGCPGIADENDKLLEILTAS